MVGLTFAADVPLAANVAALSPDLLDKVWWIPALPLAAFLLIIFVTRRSRNLSAAISMVALFVAFLVAASVFWARMQHPQAPPQSMELTWLVAGPLNVSLGVLVDNLSAAMLTMVTLVGFLIQVYSTGYMSHEPDFNFAKFFSYLSLFTASMLGLVVATNFVQIYVCWELVGLCSYLLIGFWYYKKSAADAAKKAFVVTRFGDLGFLVGILLIFSMTGALAFLGDDGALHRMALFASSHPELLALACVLIFCGAVGKSAQFPLHIWLPDAMEGPTPVSALIHAATMVAAGVYLVARCFEMFSASPLGLDVVAYVGAFTAFLAATMGVVNNDIKRVLAYSTVSQLGYMFLALGIGTQASYVAGTFHLLTHAFFKSLLFLCAGSVIHAVETNDMWEMGGLRRHMPITHLTFLAGGLALSGVPPFAGFWSKDEILSAAVGAGAHGQVMLPILGYVAAFLTAFYTARMYFVTFWGPYRGRPREEGHGGAAHGSHEPHENPLNMTVPLMILATFATLVGFMDAGLLHWSWFSGFMAQPGAEAAAEEGSAAWLLFSVGVAALGWFAGWKLYAFEPERNEARLKARLAPFWRLLENKWYMDDIWAGLLRYTMFLGATICDWFDRNIIDGVFVVGAGRSTLFLGELLREEHSGKVQQYAMMMVVAVAVIILGVGVAEPGFVLNPVHWLRQLVSR